MFRLDCHVGLSALLAMTRWGVGERRWECVLDTGSIAVRVMIASHVLEPPLFDNARLSIFLSLRALMGVAIQSGSSYSLPMLQLDCRVACAPRNDKVGREGGMGVID